MIILKRFHEISVTRTEFRNGIAKCVFERGCVSVEFFRRFFLPGCDGLDFFFLVRIFGFDGVIFL